MFQKYLHHILEKSLYNVTQCFHSLNKCFVQFKQMFVENVTHSNKLSLESNPIFQPMIKRRSDEISNIVASYRGIKVVRKKRVLEIPVGRDSGTR